MVRRTILVGGALVLFSAALAARPEAERERPAPRRTLDDVIDRVVVEQLPDGGHVVSTTYREFVPYAEFLAMWDAERNDRVPLAPEAATLAGVCLSVDEDYDGDGFVGGAETSGSTLGDRIADLPRLTADFDYVDATLVYTVTQTGSQGSTTTYTERNDLEEKTSVTDTLEFKNNFNGKATVTLNFGFHDLKPTVGLDINEVYTAERSRSHTLNRTRSETRLVQENWTRTRTWSDNTTITVAPDAGRISAVVRIGHAGRKTAVQVNRIVVGMFAVDPTTGRKVLMTTDDRTQPFLLAANGEHSYAIIKTGINSDSLMREMEKGSLIELEVIEIDAVIQENGRPLELLDTDVRARTAMIGLHYGGQRASTLPNVEFFEVAINRPDGTCPTARELLETVKTSSNVEFGRLADGTLVLTRVGSVANRHADEDFDPANPDHDDWGRWVVGFDFDDVTGSLYEDLDLERTPLAAGDRIHLYYLTDDDLREPPRTFDRLESQSLANDGAYPQQANLDGYVSIGDEVELEVESDFRTVVPYTESRGTVYVSGCGMLYGSTFHGIRIYDSATQAITIPSLDYYGLELRVNQGAWLRMSDLLADPTLEAEVQDTEGYPFYSFRLHLKVSEQWTGGFERVPLAARNNKPRQVTYLVGFTGYAVNGAAVDCRVPQQPGAFMHNDLALRTWFYLGGPDADHDRTYAASAGGIDFDDASPFRFRFAPELLDGIDNDGDTVVDDSPLLCPTDLPPNQSATCRLDDRMGWYGAGPAVELRLRTHRQDGTATPWQTVGSVTEFPLVMPTDPTIDRLEIGATYWPPTGGAFSGSTSIRQIDPSAPVVPRVGQTIEAEGGRVTHPMQVATDGSTTWVEVPAGTTDTTGAAASYEIQIDQAGSYRISTRVYATGSSDDSFLVEVFDPAGSAVDFGYGTAAHFRLEFAVPDYPHGMFAWTQVGHTNVYVSPEQWLNPVTYRLGPGKHTIRFRPRELGTRLDQLRVERLCVDGDGDGRTDCAGDCNDANPAVYPGHGETCSTSYDDDCDGFVNEGCGGGGCRGCNYESP